MEAMEKRQIVVCPLSAVENVMNVYKPARLVTLLNADMMIETPSGLMADKHLKLAMNDINAPTEGLVAAREDQVGGLIDFIDGWEEDGPMAVHCWAGISRSTATAFVALCRLNPERGEHELAAVLRRAAPFASPNRLIVELADDIMGRKGRMIDAVNDIGRGADAWEGRVFTLERGGSPAP